MCILLLFCICLLNFVQIGSATQLWRHIHFPRWQPRRRNSTSSFLLRRLRSFGKVEIYLQTKFWRDTSIHGSDITTSGFWKQTSAMFEFYFRFLPERDYVTFGSLLSQIRLSVICLSVCRLSVTLVHPTQGVEDFGNISSLCTLAILWPPRKILWR